METESRAYDAIGKWDVDGRTNCFAVSGNFGCILQAIIKLNFFQRAVLTFKDCPFCREPPDGHFTWETERTLREHTKGDTQENACYSKADVNWKKDLSSRRLLKREEDKVLFEN